MPGRGLPLAFRDVRNVPIRGISDDVGLSKTARIVIQGRLPSMNEMIGYRGRPWWMCREVKLKAVRQVAWELNAQRVPKFTKPITLRFTWVEKDKRRDRDNVAAGGSKIFLDAMKEMDLIKDDSRKWVADIQHDTTRIDKTNPHVEVLITEVDG